MSVNPARSLVLLVLIGLSLTAPLDRAAAEDCSNFGSAENDMLLLGAACSSPSIGTQPSGSTAAGNQPAPYVAYRWTSICSADPMTPANDLECAAAMTCPDPAERRWQLWGQTGPTTWIALNTQCFGGVPPEFVPPEVTPGDVISALRRVGLPRLETRTQPEEKTLVNFDTIFFTEPRPVDLRLTILGQAVDVVATPTAYLWHFGDGTRTVTRTPGDPFPAKTITHRYERARVTVRPHVQVTYSARFRVGNGPWRDIDETVTTTGPGTDLRVAEATALLSGRHE